MPQYIRFDDNGIQIEVNTTSSKPSGDGWLKAAQNFDCSKRYRRNSDNTIREERSEENEAELLKCAKETAFDEFKFILEQYRQRFSGYSPGKSKAYETQARAALRVLDSEEAGKDIDPLDDKILSELAKVRSLTIYEMAKLIKAKMDESDIALSLIEAYEDKAAKVIEHSTNRDNLRISLEAIQAELGAITSL